MAGLALLQMLVERKGAVPEPPATKQPAPGPRQLSQSQINDLIAMSKRVPPAAAPRGNPQVAQLLEQLHKQQQAQQQQQAAPQAQPQECQQQ